MLKKFLVFPLILKVAFIYTDDRRIDHFKPGVRPTYRISTELYPNLGSTRLSAAMSEVTKTGVIKPQVVYKVRVD